MININYSEASTKSHSRKTHSRTPEDPPRHPQLAPTKPQSRLKLKMWLKIVYLGWRFQKRVLSEVIFREGNFVSPSEMLNIFTGLV